MQASEDQTARRVDPGRHMLVALQLVMDGAESTPPPDRWTATRRCRGEKAIHSVGDRPNLRGEANSDPPPKPVLDNDERWLGRWNDGTTTGDFVLQQAKIVPQTQHFFDFSHGQSLLGHSVSPLARGEIPIGCPAPLSSPAQKA
jgi:hypothetical protein